MPPTKNYNVFKACVVNFRKLDSTRKDFGKLLNEQIPRRTDADIHHLGQISALLFSVWAEARFLKIIYTPYGFDSGEIDSILACSSLEQKWCRAIDIALRHAKRSDLQRYKIRSRLRKLVRDYVVGPTLLRNKLAHGQWAIALNNSASAINSSTTASLAQMDAIRVDLWYTVFGRLAELVESLIESPEKEFQREYWAFIDSIENEVRERKKWTIESKRQILRPRYMKRLATLTKPSAPNYCSDSGTASIGSE